jgi:tripartite-type tricarboxylate transporter receptor subunit TctC
VVHELSLQFAGTLSNAFLVEFIDWTPPDLFEQMPECGDGHFRIPERPGHGTALARGAVEKMPQRPGWRRVHPAGTIGLRVILLRENSMIINGRILAALVTTAAVLAPVGAQIASAQTFPSRAITLIVPFPAGGVTDPVARLVGAKISESVGQPFLVDNRPGAASIIGAEIVKKAAPDGYTLFFGHFASHAVNPHIYDKLPYDPVRDFAPITPLIYTPSLLVVPLESPAKSVAEIVALARSKPGGLNYASQGVASGGHLLGEMLRARTGAPFNHVAYKGSGPAVQDILAGRVDMFFDALITSGVQVKAGKLRALALASPARSPLYPDVPTMAEVGYPGFELLAWFGIFAPGGTPQPVVRKLNEEFVKAMKNPEVSKRLSDQGLDIFTSTPEEFTVLIAADTLKYGKVVREANIKVD